MINPFDQWFAVPEATLRGLSTIGIATHWIILQYSIGLFTVAVLLEITARIVKNQNILNMAQKLSKVATVIFAIGAATGSLGEFGLLLFWPNFLELAGKYYFAPFFLEMFAFMAEVVFVYLFYYTWTRVSPRFHIFLGVMVVIGLFLSSMLILSANTLMTYPPGLESTYDPSTGTWQEPVFNMVFPNQTEVTLSSSDLRGILERDPQLYHDMIGATMQSKGIIYFAIINTGAMWSFLHAVLAAIMVTIFSIFGVYSYRFYRVSKEKQQYYRDGLKAMTVLSLITFALQAVVGHSVAHAVAHYAPEKLAAIEGTSNDFAGVTDIPVIGGFLERMVAFLSYGSFSAELPDYDAIPADYQAPLIIHYIYYLKLLLIGILGLVALTFAYYYFIKKRDAPRWLMAFNYSSPVLVQVVSNSGWMVREIGRKPWTIYGQMTVTEAARETPIPPWVFWGVIGYFIVMLGGLALVIFLLFRLKDDERSPQVVEHLEEEEKESYQEFIVASKEIELLEEIEEEEEIDT